MNAMQAIRMSLDMAKMISDSYILDLNDKEWMHRPHPGCNHIIWQVGHLIHSEHKMIDGCIPGSMPPLPDGFGSRYSKETAGTDDPGSFHSRQELIDLMNRQREGTLAALAKCSETDLDKPAPEAMRSYAPTFGAAFDMQGSHWLMHAGQWAVIRRQLGRTPIF